MSFNLLQPNVMVDLETVGTHFDAGILSIGAVKFDHSNILSEFYVNIKLSSIKSYGLQIDPETLKWWNEQKPGAIEALFKKSITLDAALTRFNKWYGDVSLSTWSNGADFDQVIMRTSYRAAGMKEPWDFRDGLCFRTMKNVFNMKDLWPDDSEKGVEHNALDDARFQAKHLQNIWLAWA